jgi:pimeloyl-ACP methyl ester carboxylesterase
VDRDVGSMPGESESREHSLGTVLLVPGGVSSVDGYFAALEALLAPHARLLASDPPQGEPVDGSVAVRLRARRLAQAVRRETAGPVVVVGHSLGALVALRIALDEPELVGGLLLLDPSPEAMGALAPGRLLRLISRARRATARLPVTGPSRVRIPWSLLFGGIGLAADLAAGRLAGIPTTLVSAGEHAPTSIARRWHQRLVEWMPGASLEIWPDTTHRLHVEQPDRVAASAVALLKA